MAEISPELTAAIERLTNSARLELLRAMVNPEAGRLERIQGLEEREDTHEVAGLLIDLEGDAWACALATEALLHPIPRLG